MPKDFLTLAELLIQRFQQTPAKTAFIFQDVRYTYRDLWEGATAFAATLHREGVSQGDRVVLALPNSERFLFGFFGTQRMGAVPVPLFPDSGTTRLITIAGLCRAKAILVPADFDDLQRLQTKAARLNVAVITSFNDEDTTVALTATPALQPESLALIHYTSGSTTDPRGVMLTHENIFASIRQMVVTANLTEQDIFINSQPIYHHFNLIVMALIPLYLGAELVLLESDLNVRRWLEAIGRYRGSVTVSADYGYRLCNRTIKNPAEYDLSSLRIALNLGERIYAATIADFERNFSLKNVVKPAYGLAESSAAVSLWNGDAPAVDENGVVSVGKPLSGVDVQIIKDGQSVANGESGEIVVRGANISTGYFCNTDATAELPWQDGYIYTGDIGYRDFEGDLYVLGNKKHFLVTSGRSIAIQEVEEIVDGLPGVRCSAVIGVEGKDGEQIIVFAEVRMNETDLERESADTTREIVRGIYEAMGFRPAWICLVKPYTIPLTPNGSVEHTALREKYLNGQLNILYPRS